MPVFRTAAGQHSRTRQNSTAGRDSIAGRITGAVAGAAALLTLAGCDLAAEHQLDFSNTENVRITRITVSPGSGDVAIRTAAVSTVRIDRFVRYRGAEPDTSYRIDGTELFIDTDCGHHCSVSFDVLAPEGVTVRGGNGSGDTVFTRTGAVDYTIGSGSVELIDPTGEVRVEATGSGDITVTGASSAVTLRTKSGSINGRGLGGAAVRAETSSGDIELTLDKPASVRADTNSGKVRLAVPAGRYQVRADTDSGEPDVRIPHDPDAALTLAIRTSSGDITIDGS